MNATLRIIAALSLFVGLLFCAFGFLATFEYAEASQRVPWQAAYGLSGLACVIALGFLFRRGRDPGDRP